MAKLRNVMGIATAIALGAVAIVHAQSSTAVLHEDISVPKVESDRTAKRIADGVPIIGPTPKERQNPTAIASQDKLLAEPQARPNANKQEPVHGRKEFGADRQTESKLDYSTEADSTLRYIGVFNPSIVPFKRMSAMDGVRDDYTLYSSGNALADLKVGGSPEPGSDLFWGSIMVDLSPGKDVAIASVAPDMQILSYETTPATNLKFSVDTSDNFYLRSDESGVSGTYRVVFLAQASSSYFVPSVPKRMRVRDIPSHNLTPLPDKIQKVADNVLDKMRLHKNMFVDDALNKLVYYFRSFDAKAPPPQSGDIYWDLYSSQAGVCRHRSFAFMITANALGIPTRYVTNEAHAWVEVWLPQSQWMRIDLGGAAATLDISNATDKSMYRPRGEDPFAKPDSYNENYTKLEGDIKGLRPDQIAEKQRPYEAQDGTGGGQGNDNGSFFGVDDGPDQLSSESGPLTGPGSGLPSVPEEELAGKEVTQSKVLSATAAGYRGENISVQGIVRSAKGTGIPDLRMDIFLAPAGNEGNDALLVGRGISDAQGMATVEVELPIELQTMLYEVYISTPGNTEFQPSVSSD